ncbi:MAG: NAD(P)H-hydrate dehydratase [Ruminococcaceae bacterium]|nr:NAD(P)H-hydrate dehydratase [Oscillospiraceae bacterium]
MYRIDRTYVKNLLPARDPYGHKGTFGKVLCICGSVGYTGAPIFASRAAVRTGSGLVFLAVPESIWQVAAVKSDEAMPFPLPDRDGKLHGCFAQIKSRADACDAVLYGCGLGRSDALDEMVRDVLTLRQPLVLDADGINALSAHMDVLQRRGGITVLTPHEGEFLRVGGDLSRGRIDGAADFAVKYGVYLVLKGHETLVAAPDGRLAVNTTGNSGMAKGGSGDVLAGMIVSLLGQRMDAFDACCAAVYLHGRAGDLAAADKGERGMTPTDLLENIPYALKETES